MCDKVKLNAIGLTVATAVSRYFSDERHRTEFEEWYLKHYGKPYDWKEGNNE